MAAEQTKKQSKIFHYAWAISVVMLFTQFIINGARQGTGTLLAYIADDLGITVAAAAVIVSSFHLGQVIGAPVWGNVVDRIGLRKTIGASTILCSVFVILFGFFANSVVICCIMMFVIGAGTSGFKDATTPKLVSIWFSPSMRGKGVIPITFGGTIAGVVMGVLVPALMSNFSWNYTYIILGCIDLAIAIVTFLVVRDDPKEMGLLPCGAEAQVGQPVAEAKKEKPLGFFESFAKGFKLKNAWIIAAINFAGQVYLSGCMTNTVAALLGIGFDVTEAGLCLSIFSATMCISQIVFPLLADKIPTKNVLSIMYIGFIACGVLMWWCYNNADNIAIIYAMCTISGLFFGQVPVIMIQQASSFPVALRGAGSGLVAAVGAIGSVAGPLIAGAAIAATGVTYGFVYSGLIAAVIAFALTFLLPKTGGKYGDPFLNADGTPKDEKDVVLKR